MNKLWTLFLFTTLHAPPKFLSISSDSALIPQTISPEEYSTIESELFTYQQLADIRKKHIERLKKKLDKKKRVRIIRRKRQKNAKKD